MLFILVDIRAPVILAQWCDRQARALFHLLVMPTATTQFERPPAAWRNFFTSSAGEARRRDVGLRHGLEPVFRTHLQPQFVDEADITLLYGSTDGCLDRLGRLFLPLLREFELAGVSLDQIEAERYISTVQDGFRLAGQSTF